MYLYTILVKMNQHSVDIFSGPVPKVTNFSRYNTKFSGENKILCRIFRVVSSFPLHFVLYR